MEMPPTTRPASHRWWFRLLILCCFLIPPMTGLSYDPARTTEVVRAVLQEPYAMFIPALLPIAKLLLASAAVLPFLGTRWSGRFVVGYYAAILLVISFLQNMAATEQFGFVWLIGNTVVQLIVASFRLVDVLAGSTTLHRIACSVGACGSWCPSPGVADAILDRRGTRRCIRRDGVVERGRSHLLHDHPGRTGRPVALPERRRPPRARRCVLRRSDLRCDQHGRVVRFESAGLVDESPAHPAGGDCRTWTDRLPVPARSRQPKPGGRPDISLSLPGGERGTPQQPCPVRSKMASPAHWSPQ